MIPIDTQVSRSKVRIKGQAYRSYVVEGGISDLQTSIFIYSSVEGGNMKKATRTSNPSGGAHSSDSYSPARAGGSYSELMRRHNRSEVGFLHAAVVNIVLFKTVCCLWHFQFMYSDVPLIQTRLFPIDISGLTSFPD